MDDLRASSGNIILLDSGNVLFSHNRKRELLQQDVITAKGIHKIYEALDYQAVGVGPYDLTAGADVLLDMAGSVPWISSNITTMDGNYLFPPWALLEHEEKTIGVLALTGSPGQPDKDYRISDWSEALDAVLEKIGSRCDALILLSSLDTSTNQLIAEQYPAIELILTAEKRSGNRPPKVIGNALASQVQSRGRYLGVLTYPGGIDGMRLAQGKNAGFQHRLIALHPSLEKSEPIERLVVEVKKAAAKAGKRARYQPQQTSPQQQAPRPLADSSYTNCVGCHRKMVDSWKHKAHAKAYRTLVEEDQQYNL